MILYTMMPYEQVFPPEEEITAESFVLSYKGVPVVAEWTDQNEYRIVRIISTDPNHFMDPSCVPGSKISLL